MSDASSKHDKLLEEEQQLQNKITTCQTMLQVVFNALQDETVNLHLLTVEDIVVLIHSFEANAHTELLHLWFEKSVRGNKLGNQ
ncbi:hypothetical protein [Paenibacillus radicis (ex Xue et al. 2023)]|uniref:Uncharacterized protein n=1 Tax=Paenibacillus radicis (ex Xue et al. 2023) TaxID=2972489 RepID=A0ABT1YL82_9BACL|nr:hypothetical protein [Paenibacillus radicis (ex Xue et al. 2023)]MCR8633933.1 hypothetical protein [Paenibacillus radicis (ex Xue et al. 2023)]